MYCLELLIYQIYPLISIKALSYPCFLDSILQGKFRPILHRKSRIHYNISIYNIHFTNVQLASRIHLILQRCTLHEKYPYLELFWSVFLRIWTEYEEIRSISPYSVQMWENTDYKKSEHGHFWRRDTFRTLWNIYERAFYENSW